jgi:ABC-type multidrug transport system ATPase subunit
MQIVKILESVSKYFGTDSISRKTTEARNDLIASNFNDIFKRELKSLRRDIKINMSFKTEKAKPILIQDICADYALSDVLSEGEQKAIAMAEFLTEIQLDRSKATIILDDPVTSLDHKIIDEVARRLVGLSKDRQVVLFTHSILLFNSIKQMSELMLFKDLEYKYYETESDMETAGILYESTSLKGDSFKNYKTKINEIINLPREERERRESDLAIEGYNKLRAAIEVFVEQEMLKNTVKRYRKNVAITSLERVDGALIDKHKNNINTVFERCCLYTDAHSNPDDVSSKPTLSELKTDYEEIFNIRSEFVN